MPRLTVYSTKSIAELVASYELACTDLARQHDELSTMTANLHRQYLESFARSRGKSVAEKNRTADYETKDEYANILIARGAVNNLTTHKNMLGDLISWRLHVDTKSYTTPTHYPLDTDKDRIGHV